MIIDDYLDVAKDCSDQLDIFSPFVGPSNAGRKWVWRRKESELLRSISKRESTSLFRY